MHWRGIPTRLQQGPKQSLQTQKKNVLMFQDQPFQRRSALPREYQSGTIKCRSAPIGANYFIECAAAKRLTMGAALPIGHQTLDFSDTSRTSHRWTDAWRSSEIRWSLNLKNIGPDGLVKRIPLLTMVSFKKNEKTMKANLKP